MSGNPNAIRKLIWVPVIHTQADLGSMSESIRQLQISKLGKAKWSRRTEDVEQLWRQVQQEIKSLQLDCTRVRLYQDGLPISGHEADIVRDLAHAGSHNHRILLDLMDKGATLTGTESPELLLQEYELARQVLVSLRSGEPRAAARRQQEFSKQLLDRRDNFIADRISRTLQPEETGLIFLGMLHSLEGLLAPDIRVSRLGQQSELPRAKRHRFTNQQELPSEQDNLACPQGPDHG